MTDDGPSSPTDPVPSSAGPPPRAGVGTSLPVDTGESVPVDGLWDRAPEGPTVSDKPGARGQLRTLIEWVAVAVGALAVALLIKAFLLQAFFIPSGSMEPTLHQDDRVLVNKLSYRLGDAGRGDIVVFPRPPSISDDVDHFIKRVVALPGETISFSDGTVFVDGRALFEDYVNGAATSSSGPIPGCANEIAVSDSCTVPDGTVFVMGDNRGGSTDSRRFGPIDSESIVGRAFLKVWPISDIGFL